MVLALIMELGEIKQAMTTTYRRQHHSPSQSARLEHPKEKARIAHAICDRPDKPHKDHPTEYTVQ